MPIASIGCGTDRITGHRADGGGGGGGGGERDGSDGPIEGVDYDLSTGACGAQTVPINVENLGVPPDLLIILDRSLSMTAPVNPFQLGGPTRWEMMKGALKQVTDARQTQIHFGLSVFPTDDDCAVSAGTAVPIDLNNAPAVASWLDNNKPGGATPAHLALQEAKRILDARPANPSGRYVLFSTDGIPNCGGPAMDQSTEAEALDAIRALRAAGIQTYVLGFGSGFFSTGGEFLTQASMEGGVPRAGSPNYYAAGSASDLENALSTIARGIIRPSCSFRLESAPPAPDDVTVLFNGNPIGRSTQHTDGWDYGADATTITLFGSACTELMSGAVSSVEFRYGCPGPVVN